MGFAGYIHWLPCTAVKWNLINSLSQAVVLPSIALSPSRKNEKEIGNGRTNEHTNICIDIKTEVREAD
jgi:hypothetical protein